MLEKLINILEDKNLKREDLERLVKTLNDTEYLTKYSDYVEKDVMAGTADKLNSGKGLQLKDLLKITDRVDGIANLTDLVFKAMDLKNSAENRLKDPLIKQLNDIQNDLKNMDQDDIETKREKLAAIEKKNKAIDSELQARWKKIEAMDAEIRESERKTNLMISDMFDSQTRPPKLTGTRNLRKEKPDDPQD
jgi:Na+/phosphate symporter